MVLLEIMLLTESKNIEVYLDFLDNLLCRHNLKTFHLMANVVLITYRVQIYHNSLISDQLDDQFPGRWSGSRRQAVQFLAKSPD